MTKTNSWRKSKTLLVIVAIFAIALIAFALTKTKEQKELVATVNGEVLYMEDVNSQYADLPENLKSQMSRDEYIEYMINEIVLDQKAIKMGIIVPEDELQETYQTLLDSQGLTQEEFLKALAEKETTGEEFTQLLEKRIRITKLVQKIAEGVEINENQTREIYEANIDQLTTGESVNASHILVETEEEAKEVLKELDAGTDFFELAKEKSIDPSAQVNGGNMGFFTKGMMVPEFEKAAFGLNKGQISEPVKTSFGYHVILLHEKKDASVMPYEEAKPMIEQQLIEQNRAQILEDFVDEEKSKADIEIFYDGIKKQELKIN